MEREQRGGSSTTLDRFMDQPRPKDIIAYARANGGPITQIFVKLITQEKKIKIKKNGHSSTVLFKSNNPHLIERLWWRYDHNMIGE